MNTQQCVFIIEDDDAVRDGLRMIIENAGYMQQSFDNIERFFKAYNPGTLGCLIPLMPTCQVRLIWSFWTNSSFAISLCQLSFSDDMVICPRL